MIIVLARTGKSLKDIPNTKKIQILKTPTEISLNNSLDVHKYFV
jgi:hypothetical protein